MELDECKTVKECLLWAEQQFPGFWEFANCKPLSEEEIDDLVAAIEGSPHYNALLIKLEEVVPTDITEEASQLLSKGAKSFKFLEKRNDHR